MNILEIGIQKGMADAIKKMYLKGYSVKEIADILEEKVEVVKGIIEELKEN